MHGQRVSALKPCSKCVSNPPAAPIAGVEPDPENEAENLAAEGRVRTLRMTLSGEFERFTEHRRSMDNQDTHGINSMCKLAEQIQKCERLEFELRNPRIQRKHEKYVADAAKALAAVGQAH